MRTEIPIDEHDTGIQSIKLALSEVIEAVSKLHLENKELKAKTNTALIFMANHLSRSTDIEFTDAMSAVLDLVDMSEEYLMEMETRPIKEKCKSFLNSLPGISNSNREIDLASRMASLYRVD